MTDIVDLKTAVARIKRDPNLRELRLPEPVIAKIRDELQDLQMVKNGPRPVPGSHPWAASDALLWDEREALRKRASVTLMGVPVVAQS